MTLEQLRIFIAVAEREHVTQAARDLNLTQSATSSAIAVLEARYQTKLFDRVGRGIVLTSAGHTFLAEAKAVLARAEAAEHVLADLAGLRRGTIHIAASQTVGNYWLPRYLHKFKEAHPGISVSLTIGNTAQVAALLREGVANLGFVEGEVRDPRIDATPIASDELLLVANPSHPWAVQMDEPLDFKKVNWVLREIGSGTRDIVSSLIADHGLTVNDVSVSLVLPSNEAVVAAVEAGAGVTVTSRLVIALAIETGRMAIIEYPVPRRHFFMLRHRDFHETVAVQGFIEMIERARNIELTD
ncbi:LysR substrate-binding domain-containing protein [Pseudaminobacter salicylatoxidans]|uniref:DNA-binding transcriptional LysR family regulator n=1 Tax=Pseudaminobacter salicylatoxidans TaxID=93369 RepID=A0A316BIY0_PSESE|nr:LysR substrate-binding domain-containing protein [Pseudaminobacter salicylatoxidans]PWJ72822.1 DNA-binding transcriptional LysR family regulator [Pseudaminobacter salicylatoxidans]